MLMQHISTELSKVHINEEDEKDDDNLEKDNLVAVAEDFANWKCRYELCLISEQSCTCHETCHCKWPRHFQISQSHFMLTINHDLDLSNCANFSYLLRKIHGRPSVKKDFATFNVIVLLYFRQCEERQESGEGEAFSTEIYGLGSADHWPLSDM